MDYLNANNYDSWLIYRHLIGDIEGNEYNPWIGSIIGSIIVGLTGVVPLWIIRIDGGVNFTEGAGAKKLKLLLSFAVGGLLGDVFLHLLPEAWNSHQRLKTEDANQNESILSLFCGVWVLTGLLMFTILDKIFSAKKDDVIDNEATTEIEPPDLLNSNEQYTSVNNNVNNLNRRFKSKNNQIKVNSNGNCNNSSNHKTVNVVKNSKQMTGYLNLAANVIDNFTHGLAVGASFVLSARVGLITTITILLHEIPHEVGDFAILLRAGFSRIKAAKLQLITASSSLVGACTAVQFSGASDALEAHTSWILPFTSGGFLHIAMVTIIPELLEEKNPKESIKQMAVLLLGVSVIAFISCIPEQVEL